MPGAWELNSPSVIVAILTRGIVPTKWSQGLRTLKIPGGRDPIYLTGMPFDHARNSACNTMLKEGYEWLFFLDDDVIPPADAIEKLMKHKLDIVSGLYYRRHLPVEPVALRNVPGGRQYVKDFQPGQLVEVDIVGAGCLLIHRRVFEGMPKPWFDWLCDHEELPEGQRISEDYAFCFPPGGWVYGKKVQKIEEVKAGHRVVTHKGSIRKVLDTNLRPYSGRMIRLCPSYGTQVEATPSHRFLVRTTVPAGRVAMVTATGFDGVDRKLRMPVKTKKTMWVEAGEIKEGDWLYIPKPKRKYRPHKTWPLSHYISLRSLEIKDGKVGYKRTRKTALKINKSLKVTPELCRLVGYAIAEQSAMSGKHGISFAFGDHEPEVINDCRNLLLSVFGAKGIIHPQKGTHAVKVDCSSKVLGRLFSALIGAGAKNKHLPREWYRLDEVCARELVKGYWRGDGHYDRKNGFGMTTSSEKLAHEIRSILLQFGILSAVYNKKDSGAFEISIPGPMTKRFGEFVDHACDDHVYKSKWSFMRETKTHFLVKISKVEEFIYEGFVHNLKVAGVESYTLNGIAVHNCEKAKKHGFKVHLDTSIQCEHAGLGKAFAPGKFEPLGI